MKRTTKICLLASVVALMVMLLVPATAYGWASYAADCAGCHSGAGTVAATPSKTTLAPNEIYTVNVVITEGSSVGLGTGYWIANSNSSGATGTSTGVLGGSVNGVIMTSQTYTANMTAPTTAGTYYYKVFGEDGTSSAGRTGTAIYSITVTTTTVTAPDAPTNLTAAAGTGQGQINLTWTASTTAGVTGYNVYRSLSGTGSWANIAPLGVATLYNDTGLNASTTYDYQVKAVKTVESAASNTATAMTLEGENPLPPPVIGHGYIAPKLTSDYSWKKVCNSCHGRSHDRSGCARCHGPGDSEDVHSVSRHSNCSTCHTILAADKGLNCSGCHDMHDGGHDGSSYGGGDSHDGSSYGGGDSHDGSSYGGGDSHDGSSYGGGSRHGRR